MRSTPRPADVERLAVILVAAFLGGDVDEARVGAADFRRCAGMHNLKLAHHRLREEERTVVRAALATLQRVGEVGAVTAALPCVGTLAVNDQSG